MKFCTFIKSDGKPCRAQAMKDDPEGLCFFHSPKQGETARKAHVVTVAELLTTLGREIRRIRNDKSLSPLARAAEVRNLVAEWGKLKAYESPNAPAATGTLEKRLEKWKTDQPSSKP